MVGTQERIISGYRLQQPAARSGGLGSGVWGGTHEHMNMWHMEVIERRIRDIGVCECVRVLRNFCCGMCDVAIYGSSFKSIASLTYS